MTSLDRDAALSDRLCRRVHARDDNVFVISLLFTYFAVPREYQHRVLFWASSA